MPACCFRMPRHGRAPGPRPYSYDKGVTEHRDLTLQFFHPYNRGTPKSLQIFLASLLSISVCRGMAVRLPVSALPHHECLLPSRTT